MKKRILTFILAVLFIIPAFSLYSAAAVQTGSGTCGNNATWVLDEAGTLTISGTGAMSSFKVSGDSTSYNTFPYYRALKNLVIEEGITSIPSEAFYECIALKTVSLADSITSIGNKAFYSCSLLESVTLPASLTRIYSYAFYKCIKLASVEMNSILNQIDQYAFAECYKLTSIAIPDSVQIIEKNAFENCNRLSDISIGNGVTEIQDNVFNGTAYLNDENNWENGQLYIDSCLIKINSSAPSDLVVKDGTELIAQQAAQDLHILTSLYLPDGLEYINGDALSNGFINNTCVILRLPYTVKRLVYRSFWAQHITDLYYTGTTREWNNVTKEAFTLNNENYWDYFHYHDIDEYDEVTVVKEPTCTEMGQTAYTCLCRQRTFTYTDIDMLPHEYTSEITTYPTTSAEGVRTYTCANCGDTYTETLPPITAPVTVTNMGVGQYNEAKSGIRVFFETDRDIFTNEKILEVGAIIRNPAKTDEAMKVETDGSLIAAAGQAKVVIAKNNQQVGKLYSNDNGKLQFTVLLTNVRDHDKKYDFRAYAIYEDEYGQKHVKYSSSYLNVSYNSLLGV